jgi:hypothetical protein
MSMSKTESVRRGAANRARDLANNAPAIRKELKRISESSVFRSSRRSRLFLEYIVDKALVGHLDELKERVIGLALFGRPADYDTGADSIVRVVANETRRRLQAYQAQQENGGPVRIELPVGSYLPIVHYWPQAPDHDPAESSAMPPLTGAAQEGDAAIHISVRPPVFRVLWPAATLILAAVCVALIAQNQGFRRRVADGKPAGVTGVVQPWSALFTGNRGVQIILADTSVGIIQNLLKTQLPLADYVNRQYIPRDKKIGPELDRFLSILLASENTSSAYATTAVRIAQLGQSHSVPVSVTFAREMSLRTFKGGGNFVVLGTTRANPWAQLFDSQLNFSVEFSPESSEPRLLNRAPRAGEDSVYVARPGPSPTVRESYGHIAFIPSLFKGGQFLLVTGTSSAATEASGELLTNENRLRAALVKLGADPFGEPRSFEILLRVRVTSSAPIQFEVVTGRLGPTEKRGGSRPLSSRASTR